MTKWIVFIGLSGFAILVWTFILIPESPAQPQGGTQPKITWMPKSTEIILSPGESTTQEFTFTSDQDLQNAVIEAVPGIAAFLSIQPTSFSSVQANQQQAVHITFSNPATASLGTFDGTIHIRIGNKTLPQTLKVLLNIWRKSQLTDNGQTVEFLYPPSWELSSDGSAVFLDNPAFSEPIAVGCEFQDPPCSAEDPPEASLRIIGNSTAAPLGDFVAAYRGGRYSRYQQLSPLTISGHDAFVAHDPVRVPNFAAFFKTSTTTVAIVTGSGLAEEEFFALLQALKLP